MTQRKALLILHGKQALNEEVRAAVGAKRKEGLEVRVAWAAHDAQRLVCEALAAGHRKIIAGGGDGTLREIAEALVLADAQYKHEISLVLLPMGTANDFARAGGVPMGAKAALDLLDVAPSKVDVGDVSGQLFLNMATGGFGSQVTANTSEDLKKVLGAAAYLFTGLSRFSELRAA
jgi:lipid kinase YegS